MGMMDCSLDFLALALSACRGVLGFAVSVAFDVYLMLVHPACCT
jgi:hypothetical protein